MIIEILLCVAVALAVGALAAAMLRLSAARAEAASQRQRAESLDAQIQQVRADRLRYEDEVARRLEEVKAEADRRIEEVKAEGARRLAEAKEETEKRLAENREEAARHLRQHDEQAREDREQMLRLGEERFKNLANSILEDNSKRFRELGENNLLKLISPLKERFEQFTKRVDEVYSEEARERFALRDQLREMMAMNETISRDARDLSSALRGNAKVQGDWGEMVLESILSKSGLQRDVHYFVQQTVTDPVTGRTLRPDVVFTYPDRRCVVVDSKVSLTAYIDSVNAEDIATRDAKLAAHLQSVRAHLKELADKSYQDIVGDKRTDFVMMFIPNEGAYLAAMNAQPDIWQEAYDKHVLIVSPTHLVSALRLIEQLWRQDDMTRNVLNIATEAGRMYDKFVGFVADLTTIEKGLDQARKAYDNAFSKLRDGRGNLIGRAEKIRVMGAKASKQLSPDLTENVDPDDALLTSPEEQA